MKTIFYHLLRALLVWGSAPDGHEWASACENIFAETTEKR